MARERRSLQDLIRSRQQSGFVGRQRQVIQYKENLGIPVDDGERRFLFNIYGDAGVGKTYLSKQLRQIAIDGGSLTAYTDDSATDVISVMNAISDQLRRAGIRLAEFDKRAAAYSQRRHELESDPNAPDGIAAFVTKSAVKIGLHAARDVPIAGSVLAPVNADAAADQVNRARVYLARKFSDRADLRLLLSPAEELTPFFVAGLNDEDIDRPIALFFDTYERTAPFLDGWIRDLYSGRYGNLPAELVTTISGQLPLDPNLWGDYIPVLADVPLEPFSETEARQFLASKGVTEEATIEVILTLSGYLPMWLATLADARPENAAHIGDPAGSAVERFLKWEEDPGRRATAIVAALPRALNQDVLNVLIEPGKDIEVFNWLCGLPFVARQAESWKYHEVVRAAMLRLQRAQSPVQWRANHAILAQAHAQWANEATGSDGDIWSSLPAIEHIREQAYHAMCADPTNKLPEALALAVKAAESSIVDARRWAELLTDAGHDSDNLLVTQWGQRLQSDLREASLSAYLSRLINEARLEVADLVLAFEERGIARRGTDNYEEGLADFNRAIELDPNRVWSIAGRGETYRLMDRYDEALADLNRAIELDPSYDWAIARRGLIYQELKRYDEALADFTCAIELDPSADWAIACRGLIYQELMRYDEALADFTCAIELDPGADWAISSRGETYRRMGRYDEALAEFNRAIELDPNDSVAIGSRGQTYQQFKRYDEALADLNRAIELDPSADWAIASRSQTYRRMGRYEEALADLNRAAEIGSPPERPAQ